MKRYSIHLSLLCLFSMTLMAACGSLWKKSGGDICTQQWRAEIPQAWMRLDADDYTIFSKDGPHRQYILIQTRPLERPYRNLNRRIEEHMLPHEAAQIIIDDLRADTAIRHLEIEENRPVMIDGRLGFKLSYHYQDNQDAVQQTHLYGIISKPYLISLRYNAERQRYFKKNLADFENVLKSFRLPN
jgi:hypothetical protein